MHFSVVDFSVITFIVSTVGSNQPLYLNSENVLVSWMLTAESRAESAEQLSLHSAVLMAKSLRSHVFVGCKKYGIR